MRGHRPPQRQPLKHDALSAIKEENASLNITGENNLIFWEDSRVDYDAAVAGVCELVEAEG